MNDFTSRRLRLSHLFLGLLAGCLAGLLLVPSAYAAGAKTYHPTRTDDPAPNGCKQTDCSLREAVIAANAARGGTIVLRPGKRYQLTRRGAGEDAAMTGDLDLHATVEVRTKGRRGPAATIDANGIDRIFDGKPTDFGGVQILPANSPTLNRVILRDGHARAIAGDNGNGGAVRGRPRVIDSRLISNVADGRGGAIYFGNGPGAISRTTLKDNRAASDGGAVYFFQACNGPENHLGFQRSRATHNRAGGNGGAIFSYCIAQITRSKLDANFASGAGGGLFSPGTIVPPEATTPDPSEWWSRVEMFESTVAGNRSRNFGGGLALDGGAGASVSRSTVSGNSTTSSGGGIGINDLSARPPVSLGVENSTVANNGAGHDGGGIGSTDPQQLFNGHATISLDHVTITRNQANTELVGGAQRDGTGGGIYIQGDDRASVHNSILALNTAAVAAFRRPPRVSDCDGAPYESLGHNLIGNPVSCNGFGAVGDLFGGKLRLGKLSSNGGPTRTIALMNGSRAINHADTKATPLSDTDDQRGFRRGKKPDIGAFERGGQKPGAKRK